MRGLPRRDGGGSPQRANAGGPSAGSVRPLPQRWALWLAGLAGQHAFPARYGLCHVPRSTQCLVEGCDPRDGSALYTDASQLCITCHQDVSMNFPYTQHQQQGVTCIDCHVTHSEASLLEAHTMPDHSFRANLNSCNACHSDQMHSPAQALGTDQAALTTVPAAPQLQQAGLNAEPSPVSPWATRVWPR